ncbi:hypothetical protein IPZ60_01530 [Psychrobacter sp. NG25]|uniref:hypothetical protein n=1 Tax=Psychrobacter sp. NG25 TaxID=2782005 RepID=UPI0018834A36|nr:hypothetical protein [Psychrobacter sp. NG25]MBF0657414.1 hypothetical protein [Psychrobacter sp. NG25]
MRTLQRSTVKTILSSGLAVALLGTMVGCTTIASPYDNRPVYRDSNTSNNNVNRVSQQLRQDLRRNGYDVRDIQASNYRGNQILTAYAIKGKQAYELKYTYPDLRLISSDKKSWSSNGKEGKYKDNGKHKNSKHHKNDDVEDSIIREARYPAIKQQAVRKVSAMGYRVKDIELEEKNNRGVFEIEAKRGSQDYEILLGYPNLNIIQVKKD